MLLTYIGRKTGKQYTIPIGYFVWEEGELLSFSSARWWTNLSSSPPVTLLLKGSRVQAVPTVDPREKRPAENKGAAAENQDRAVKRGCFA